MDRFGLPSRVRGDAGSENIDIAHFINEHRGLNQFSGWTKRAQPEDRKAMGRGKQGPVRILQRFVSFFGGRRNFTNQKPHPH